MYIFVTATYYYKQYDDRQAETSPALVCMAGRSSETKPMKVSELVLVGADEREEFCGATDADGAVGKSALIEVIIDRP